MITTKKAIRANCTNADIHDSGRVRSITVYNSREEVTHPVYRNGFVIVHNQGRIQPYTIWRDKIVERFCYTEEEAIEFTRQAAVKW